MCQLRYSRGRRLVRVSFICPGRNFLLNYLAFACSGYDFVSIFRLKQWSGFNCYRLIGFNRAYISQKLIF